MADVLLILLILAAVVAAALELRRRRRSGSICCGEHMPAHQRLVVSDRDRSHYPHVLTLRIGGMTCENCAIRVENSLNGLPGTLATVNISTREATVRCKEEPDLDTLREAVRTAGYVVLDDVLRTGR